MPQKRKKEVKMKKICMFLVLCLATMGVYGHAGDNDITQIDFMAKGLDEDIGFYEAQHSATTLIVGKIVFDEVSGLPILGDVEFHMTIYDESRKVYSIKGHLENTTFVMYPVPNYCTVRKVTWINLWYVMGMGKVKTTEAITIDYRGEEITLLDTEGKFVNLPIVFAVSSLGEILEGEPWGGWAFAGVVLPSGKTFGGITWLTKFVENWVP
ncbi:hypothetical protein ES703_64717 [subsurface metagenome]